MLLLTGNIAAAEENNPLTSVYNPDFPPPLIAEHEPTGDEYFTDAVFVGDSMMEYVELLGEIPTANYVWKVGMSPTSLGYKMFRVRGQEEYLTAYEMIAQYQPKKIFILLGGNGLDFSVASIVIENYSQMIDELLAHCPDAMIYAIAPPPGSAKNMEAYGVSPNRYKDFSLLLQQLAEEKGLYFLDFYSIIADEEGALPPKYDCGDGYHLSTLAYQKLIDLVRRHTVPYPETK